MSRPSRRALIVGGLGLAGSAFLTACSDTGAAHGPARTFGPPTPVEPAPGQRVVEHVLTPRPVTLDLGGPTVSTWAYGDTAPGPLIRATAGDLLRVRVDNRLPDPTTVHWHGVALRNAADGVPGMTQDAIAAGQSYVYEFTVPDPGTFFYHPHVGVQLDRGLYAPLIVDDPKEPGDYDAEWVVVLDDWVDGTGRTPDEVLEELRSAGHGGMGGSGGMGGMDHGSMGHGTGAGGDAGDAADTGDVTYPHYLVNGRVPSAPETFTAKPGQRVRLRIINAGSDTIFTVALGGHELNITHSDGYAVEPVSVSSLQIGMGERYDAVVTLEDGVFPLVALPAGRQGQAMALVRTGAGAAPAPSVRPAELARTPLRGTELRAAESSRLASREPDAATPLSLDGGMGDYEWGMNGAPFGKNAPITVRQGQRLRLDVVNRTMMTHPLHLHGHTFGLVGTGLRKDTVLVRPMETVPIELDADNVGDWMAHCHNIYHAEAGMMIALEYRS